MNRAKSNPFRTFTRLMVGGALLGLDELQRQLQTWERAADHAYARELQARTVRQTEQEPRPGSLAQPLISEEQALAQGAAAGIPPAPPSDPADTPGETLRYALIGLLFESQERLETGLTTFEQIDQELGNMLSPLLNILQKSWTLAPARERFDALVTRGEAEVARWVERGREEEARSRLLTQTAGQLTFESSVHQIAINPEVQELVQKQGTGLANEVIEEVRERAVSADTLMERLARSLLRRTPREQLPEPPAAVRIRAEHIRSIEQLEA